MRLHEFFDKLDVGAELHQRTKPETSSHITVNGRWYVTFPSFFKLDTFRNGEWVRYSIQAEGPTPHAAWAAMAKHLSNVLIRVTNTMRTPAESFYGQYKLVP